jgi:hypothetical protein
MISNVTAVPAETGRPVAVDEGAVRVSTVAEVLANPHAVVVAATGEPAEAVPVAIVWLFVATLIAIAVFAKLAASAGAVPVLEANVSEIVPESGNPEPVVTGTVKRMSLLVEPPVLRFVIVSESVVSPAACAKWKKARFVVAHRSATTRTGESFCRKVFFIQYMMLAQLNY